MGTMQSDVRHRLNIRGTVYPRGSTITSEEIGSTRLEGTLKRLNWIVPRKEEPQAPAITMDETAPAALPRNKGGRPRTHPA